MKVALICYHKNAEKIYPAHWIEKFMDSIINQTYRDFDIFECDYGGDNFRVFNKAYYESVQLRNFSFAMNHLIDKCFARGYDCVANCNLDDWYSIERLEKQILLIESGFDVVSSNFALIENDEIKLTHYFHELNIHEELQKNHNIICHPSTVLSKKIWKTERYMPHQIPEEDMRLWQRGLKAGYNFVIHPDVLCFHRLHPKSVGHNLKEV